MALVKGKRRLTKSSKAEQAELLATSESDEVLEDGTTPGALVKVKGTLDEFAYATREVTREPEVLDDGTVTGGTLKSIVYTVVTGSGEEVTTQEFSESAFYRIYSPVGRQAAKELKSEE